VKVVLALLLGAGVLLLFDGLTGPSERRYPFERPRALLDQWLAEAGLATLRPARLLAVCVGTAAVGGVLVLTVVGSVAVAAVALLAGGYLPVAIVRSRRRSRRAAQRACWPETVELLAGAVRAGDTLPGALGVVSERGPEALRAPFRAVVADHRLGGDLDGALRRMGVELADPVADRVVATLRLAHRVGGHDLGRVLRTLGAFLREDLAVRREIEARQSWTLVAARVAAASPWLVLLLVASRPQSIEAFDSPSGVVVLVGGALATAVGYRLMVAMGRLPEEPRVVASAVAAEVGVG
jgi:tight adherence protein B